MSPAEAAYRAYTLTAGCALDVQPFSSLTGMQQDAWRDAALAAAGADAEIQDEIDDLEEQVDSVSQLYNDLAAAVRWFLANREQDPAKALARLESAL